MFAIGVVLDVVVHNTFDKVQEPFPNNWVGMARGDLFVGDEKESLKESLKQILKERLKESKQIVKRY